MRVAVLGLGEAGSLFANDLIEKGVEVTGWDPNPPKKMRAGFRMAENNADAANEADLILSVNLSGVSEEVAKEVLPVLDGNKIFAEMNTSSPQKKIEIENILKPSGVQFVDVAIMAPVPPKGIQTPLLLSGKGATAFKELLTAYNPNLEVLSETTGDASTRKLLRSIVYKGVAAVICEAMEAAGKFELQSYMRKQISSVIGGNDELIDRLIEGSHIHAERRIHEMKAVMEMLQEKNQSILMTEATKQNLERILNSTS